eukprot:jgi/Botrbrau1/11045/Bobra.92_2s0016.1
MNSVFVCSRYLLFAVSLCSKTSPYLFGQRPSSRYLAAVSLVGCNVRWAGSTVAKYPSILPCCILPPTS